MTETDRHEAEEGRRGRKERTEIRRGRKEEWRREGQEGM